MDDYWGYHLMIDGSNCNDNIKDKNYIISFVKQLVKDIDMVAYGEPEVPYFAGHDINKAGHSLNQFIETSNITGHFIDGHNELYLDVFSCKKFESENVFKCVRQFFGEKMAIHSMYFERKAHLKGGS